MARAVETIWLQNPGVGVGVGLCVVALVGVGLGPVTGTGITEGVAVGPEVWVVVGDDVMPEPDGLALGLAIVVPPSVL
jgi:hypothetical protein